MRNPAGGWRLRGLLCLALAAALAATERRDGTVSFSDGTTWQGAIALAPGAKLQLHDGHAVLLLDPAQVLELRFAPEVETMERAFSMPEPGRPVRVETGEPYPVRHLRAQVLLAGGERVPGHLYATALSIDLPDDGGGTERRKLPLPAKQRGKPGQRLDQLAYVSRIAFAEAEGTTGRGAAVRVAAGADELGAALRDGLVPLPVRAGDGLFRLPAPAGAEMLWAARRDGVAAVGWPAGDDALLARIRDQLPGLDDFFEGRQAVAAHRAGDDVLSLMLLTREARTTDGANKPWHVEAWRWRLDGDRALLAGRVCLLRGRTGPPPAVRIMPAWAAQRAAAELALEGWP